MLYYTEKTLRTTAMRGVKTLLFKAPPFIVAGNAFSVETHTFERTLLQ